MGFIVEGYGDFMHMSLLLMEQILELFLMILMGFIIVKAGIVTDEDSKVLLFPVSLSMPFRSIILLKLYMVV